MWKATHTATVNASPEAIWERWVDVDKWPEQDASLKSASISGPFELGSTITLQPKNAPKVKVRLALVTPNAGFVSVGKLPLATLRFTHHLEELKSGTSFTQSVSITGPMAWFYATIMGNKMEQNLVARVDKMAGLIENYPETDEV